jgi:L,D-transpeptidase catalytic domain
MRMLTIVIALLLSQAEHALAAGSPALRGNSTVVARVQHDAHVALRLSPGGRVVAVVGARTSFGSPSVFSVVRQRGPWIAVRSAELPNGRLGWIDSRRGLNYRRTAYVVEVDLSRRLLEVRDRSGVVLRTTVGIGAPSSPTPSGRYAITDEIRGRRYGSAFGCCILALSGNQTRLPSGWVGGTRLAIHGTSRPETIGAPASAGCLHASDAVLRRLERLLPLGTPVVIHP